jgi:hypothetical protein
VPHIFTNVHNASHLDLLDSNNYNRSSMAVGVVVKHPTYRPLLKTLNIVYPTLREAFIIQHPDHSMAPFTKVGQGINADNLAACRRFGIRTTPLRARDEFELIVLQFWFLSMRAMILRKW